MGNAKQVQWERQLHSASWEDCQKLDLPHQPNQWDHNPTNGESGREGRRESILKACF